MALGGGGAGDCRIRAVGGSNRLILGGGDDDTLIITNGNVGIGTGTPSTKLHVAGDVTVTGDVLLAGADCAEEFELEAGESGDPGTVVVIDDSGGLRQSHQAYDKRVAGVVSGAGDYRPGLVLDKRPSRESRIQVALVGKVWCKAEAEGRSIRVGDLLTTSSTPGHDEGYRSSWRVRSGDREGTTTSHYRTLAYSHSGRPAIGLNRITT